MKALVIATTPFYVEKGSSLRVLGMIKRLIKEGYEVDLVTYPFGRDIELENLYIYRPKITFHEKVEPGPAITKIPQDLTLLLKSLKLCGEKEYELIQGEDFEGAMIAMLCASMTRSKFNYDLHNPLSENLKIHGWGILSHILKPIESLLYEKADLIISNWKVWEDKIKTENGVHDIVTIHDEIPDGVKPVQLPDLPYIAYSGNFEEYQGVEMLIRAFSEIKDEHEILLVLVGEPNEKIKNLAKKNEVDDKIKFFGRKSIEETTYILMNSIFCVSPRLSGNQPSMKMLHYIKAGRPILATDIECNRKILEIEREIDIKFVKREIHGLKEGLIKMLEKHGQP